MTTKWLFARAISYDTSTRNGHPALVNVRPRYAGNFSCSLSDDSQGTRSRVELVDINCCLRAYRFFFWINDANDELDLLDAFIALTFVQYYLMAEWKQVDICRSPSLLRLAQQF
jgi:hypothetical protein